MHLGQIVDATGALQKLVAQNLPLQAAWDVMCMVERCNPYLSFYGQELAKVSSLDTNGERIRELLDMDMPLQIGVRPQFSLALPLLLTPSDVRALKPFIDFQEATT